MESVSSEQAVTPDLEVHWQNGLTKGNFVSLLHVSQKERPRAMVLLLTLPKDSEHGLG